MGEYGAFGFDPDEFDRVIREGSEGLRDVFERIGKFVGAPGARTGWSAIFEDLSRRPRPAPETAGEAGDGVWAIYTVERRRRRPRRTGLCDRTRRAAGKQEQRRSQAQSALPAVRHRGQRPRRRFAKSSRDSRHGGQPCCTTFESPELLIFGVPEW